ncbi:hypothetical protein [Ahrensia sp. 13_GOM-1096m]|uniref:hypothetical protein n=1 Tax=Ahrensia sp. 13_GOM-1096m TaxID=1380380 RepID=UPI00047A8CC2|nr:hypothetical protein [Ahrensia sp. 13_GOM-1096m]
MAHGQRTILRGLAVIIRRRPLLSSAFLATAALTFIFGLKAIFYLTYWTDHRQKPIASWMSINHIARVWKVDADALNGALQISDSAMNGVSIARIAQEKGEPVQVIIKQIKSVIEQEHGEPPS